MWALIFKLTTLFNVCWLIIENENEMKIIINDLDLHEHQVIKIPQCFKCFSCFLSSGTLSLCFCNLFNLETVMWGHLSIYLNIILMTSKEKIQTLAPPLIPTWTLIIFFVIGPCWLFKLTVLTFWRVNLFVKSLMLYLNCGAWL